MTRADCINGPKPCPKVGCRYHLWSDLHAGPGRKPTNARPQYGCVLDIIDARNGEPMELEEIGNLLGVTRERVRQIEAAGLRRLAGRERPKASRHYVGTPGRKAVTLDEVMHRYPSLRDSIESGSMSRRRAAQAYGVKLSSIYAMCERFGWAYREGRSESSARNLEKARAATMEARRVS